MFDNNIVVHIPSCHHFIILSKTRSDSGSGSMILYESGSRKIIGAPAESRSTSQLLFCIIAKNWRESLFGFISNTLSCVLSLSVLCVTVLREICPIHPPPSTHPPTTFPTPPPRAGFSPSPIPSVYLQYTVQLRKIH